MGAPGDEWVFSGEDAGDLIDMIATLAEYVHGPGFNGFIAWMDQKYPRLPAAAPDFIRANLVIIRSKIDSARSS